MPVVLRIGPYTFFFYSLENNEPPHIHVRRDASLLKFWLDPVELASTYGFKGHEITYIRSLVRDNQSKLLEAWYACFGG